MKTATRATRPSGTPIDVPRMVVVGRVLEDSPVTFPVDAGAVGVSMDETDEEVGAAVMKAVLTMVETTPFEFEVIVVKVEVACTKM
jgi:hypothetical protein